MQKMNYHNYLQIDKLLDCQKMQSVEVGSPAHDEMLFITVHQAYEIWFKQMLFEIDSVLEIFKQEVVDEREMGVVVARLERVNEIQRLISGQIDILETMTPQDFLEFRDLLIPASGFQSFQFRLLENRLGLPAAARIQYNHMPYHMHFAEKERAALKRSEEELNLFSAIEQWLERIPFLELEGFDFWREYQTAVEDMFVNEKEMIKSNALLDEESRERNLKIINKSEEVFSAIFSPSRYEKMREQGQWRLSHKAVLGALLIQVYREQPILHLPFRLLTTLKDIDESLTHWRYRHALMVQRMLGVKIGTGGSSGADYLRTSTETHKIFTDFFSLSSFYVKKSNIPPLPVQVQERLGFFHENTQA